jgi:hypothetical protein
MYAAMHFLISFLSEMEWEDYVPPGSLFCLGVFLMFLFDTNVCGNVLI